MADTSAAAAIADLLERDASAWYVRARTAWLILIAPIAFVAVMTVSVAARPLFLALTVEDGPVEWAQVVALAFAVAVSAMLARALWQRDLRIFAALYIVVTLGSLFVLLEEISWGQRIIGLVTPQELGEINAQGETNIHNILPIQHALGLGELLASSYAVLSALAVLVLRPRMPRLFLIVPPAFVASAFIVPAAYRLARYTLVEEAGRTVNRMAEVAELCLYVGILSFLVLAYHRLRCATADVSGEAAP